MANNLIHVRMSACVLNNGKLSGVYILKFAYNSRFLFVSLLSLYAKVISQQNVKLHSRLDHKHIFEVGPHALQGLKGV